MKDLPNFLINGDIESNLITKRYIKAEESYVTLFGDRDDLNKYLSTWDYTKKDFLELAIKLEQCVKYKKRYKYLHMLLTERIWKGIFGPFIKYKIFKIYE